MTTLLTRLGVWHRIGVYPHAKLQETLMSQLTTQRPVSFAQEQHAFRRSEDRELRKLRRKNSFFSPRNLLGMVIGVKDINAEFMMYLLMSIVFFPFLMFGGARLLGNLGVVVPVAVTVALSAVLPLLMLAAFMSSSVDKKMAAKRKTVAAARRVAERLDRKSRPVLTAEHVVVRERLDGLFRSGFLSGAAEMPMSEFVANADGVFALILEDFDSADTVLGIVETRGIYLADQVRAVLDEMRGLSTPLQDGAL